VTLATRIVSEVASEMGLVPLLWLVALHTRGRRQDVALWWLAGAFAVSWVADTAALWVDPWLVSLVYPLSQVAIVGAVFLLRADAITLIAALLTVGLAAAIVNGKPDVLLHTAAWGAAAGIVADRWELGRLRTALLVYFALGWLCWIGYAIWPGWWSWGLLQASRAAGIALFCWASVTPNLRLSR
jgi:hypothetical protein